MFNFFKDHRTYVQKWVSTCETSKSYRKSNKRHKCDIIEHLLFIKVVSRFAYRWEEHIKKIKKTNRKAKLPLGLLDPCIHYGTDQSGFEVGCFAGSELINIGLKWDSITDFMSIYHQSIKQDGIDFDIKSAIKNRMYMYSNLYSNDKGNIQKRLETLIKLIETTKDGVQPSIVPASLDAPIDIMHEIELMMLKDAVCNWFKSYMPKLIEISNVR